MSDVSGTLIWVKGSGIQSLHHQAVWELSSFPIPFGPDPACGSVGPGDQPVKSVGQGLCSDWHDKGPDPYRGPGVQPQHE